MKNINPQKIKQKVEKIGEATKESIEVNVLKFIEQIGKGLSDAQKQLSELENMYEEYCGQQNANDRTN